MFRLRRPPSRELAHVEEVHQTSPGNQQGLPFGSYHSTSGGRQTSAPLLMKMKTAFSPLYLQMQVHERHTIKPLHSSINLPFPVPPLRQQECDLQFSTRWCNRDGKPYCEACYHKRHFSEGNPSTGVRGNPVRMLLSRYKTGRTQHNNHQHEQTMRRGAVLSVEAEQ